MSGYKQALARFEEAVRAHAFRGTLCGDDVDEQYAAVDREYEAAKAALIRKLQYRQLAAEQRK